MSILKVVTKRLQDSDVTMLDARILFDKSINFFATGESQIKFDFRPYLGIDAAIIDEEISKNFENAIVKLQMGKVEELTVAEKEGVRWFKKPDEHVLIIDENNPNVVSAFLSDYQGMFSDPSSSLQQQKN